MVRFSEREYAALNRRAKDRAHADISEKAAPAPVTPMRWRCMTLVEDGRSQTGFRPCGHTAALTSWAACERHAKSHGVGARFDCVAD